MCVSVSAECKGSPLTLEDVLFAASGLVRDAPPHCYLGFEMVGCTHAGVMTLRPQMIGYAMGGCKMVSPLPTGVVSSEQPTLKPKIK